MSPFASLFIAIQQRLAAITVTVSGVEQQLFASIEQDLGQLEDASKGLNRPPVLWPCALIDIDDSIFTNMGENTQTALVNICIRIGFPPFSSTQMNAPDPYRNKALYYYDIEQAVVLALQGWSPGVITTDDTTAPVTTADLSNIFGHLIRNRVSKEDRNDLLRVRCLMFTLAMDDYSTQIQDEQVSLTFTLNPIFQLPA